MKTYLCENGIWVSEKPESYWTGAFDMHGTKIFTKDCFLNHRNFSNSPHIEFCEEAFAWRVRCNEICKHIETFKTFKEAYAQQLQYTRLCKLKDLRKKVL